MTIYSLGVLLSQFGTSLFIVPCLVLTVAPWPFRRRQVRWSGISISWRIFQFVVIYTVKGFSVVSEAVQFSRSVVSDSLQPHGLQHSRLPCPWVYSSSCPSCWWCHTTISSSVVPFSSCLNLSQHQGLFQLVSSLHQVAIVLEFQLQHQSFQWIFRTDFL